MVIKKDKYNQQQVPTLWRGKFASILDAIKNNDRDALNAVQGIRLVSENLMLELYGNINAYGCELTTLNEETWVYSACQWMIEYWDVLVDLNTIEKGLSDLSLFVRVHERGDAFEFEVISVHVS